MKIKYQLTQWRLWFGEWLIFKGLAVMPVDEPDTHIWSRHIFRACDMLRIRLTGTQTGLGR